MGFFRRVTASFGERASVSDAESFLTRSFSGGRSSAGIQVSEDSALTFAAVWACQRILAETIAHPPLNVYERKGKEKIEHADGLDIFWALKNEFNEHMTSFVARETVMGHAAGWGNGYFEIERQRSGLPVALWPMLPDRTSPEISNQKLRYVTTIDGKRHYIPAANTVHIAGFGFDGYKGYSPIHMLRNVIGLGQATETFGAKYFAQGSKSGGVLMYPGTLSATAKENIRESYEDHSAGLDKAHRLTILEEGMKFISTTIPPDDAQFLETRKFQVVEVARGYRMPLHKLQEMDRATFSNIEQQAIEFVMDTMLPWYVRWEQELNRKLFPTQALRRRYFVKFNLTSLLRGDSEARSKFYKSGIETGWMTRNEARALEDMERIDGLDEPLVPLNMQTVGASEAIKIDAPIGDQRALMLLEAARLAVKNEPGALMLLGRLVQERQDAEAQAA